jgi:WXG100 protein secretion system (Wss), protein YukD
MLASTLLVTLRGPCKTLDVELPGDIALGELLPLLLEICGCQNNAPQALSQAPAHLYVAGRGYAPLPLERTPIESEISSGTVLVLQTNGSSPVQAESHTPQWSVRRSVQPGVTTGGIGVTWQSLV